MVWIAILAIFGYFLGAIPFGVIIGKSMKGIDIRDVGSGNIGTANAIRALGPFWGGLVFLGDVAKGVIPVILVTWMPTLIPGSIPANLVPYSQVLSGFLSIIGHNNSIFLKFKGGKGIATSFGVFIALEWRAALLGLLLFGIVVGISKISSLGSLTGAISLPILMIVFKDPIPIVAFAFIASALAFYMHRENIGRLMRGEERKITDKAKVEQKPVETGDRPDACQSV
jgi:acyl phosphate:glycerol-3-phosphate acyltransferase